MWLQKAHARILEHSATTVRGIHDGYMRLRPPVTHERAVTLAEDGRSYIVTDTVSGQGTHSLEQFFHCDPRCAVRQEGGRILVDREGARIAIEPDRRVVRTGLLTGSETPMGGWFSPGYDRKVPATTIVCDTVADGSTTLVTTIHLL